MKYSIIIYMNFLLSICVYSQQIDTVHLDIDDPLVLTFKVLKKIGHEKCTCEINKKRCDMYLIEVMNILYVADSVQLPNLLENVAFITESEKVFQLGVTYSATFMTTYYGYLLYSKEIQPTSMILKSPIGYVVQVGPCSKFTFKQKLLYKLNINRDKMRKSGKLISKDENVFYQFQKLQLESN